MKIGEFDLNKVYCMNCFDMLKGIPDKSVNLVLIDPPYFQVMKTDWKGQKYEWDNQWTGIKEYQDWIKKLGLEVKRILKDNGSFYIFADDKVCAYVQVILDELFILLNSITWVKPNNLTIKGWNQYRSYAPITEKILFYSNEWDINSNKILVTKACRECKEYLRNEISKAKGEINFIKVDEIIKNPLNKRGSADKILSLASVYNHMITKKEYIKLQEWLNKDCNPNYQYLCKDYNELYLNYEKSYEDYKYIRRPFEPSKNFTDVWTFNILGVKESLGKHPTQKPLAIIKRIIETSSREGDIVLDCFMGSGTTAKASYELYRKFIGCDINQEYVNLTNGRLKQKVLTW